EAAPDNPALIFRRGQILARLERYDEALAEFDRVLEEQSVEPQVLLEKADVLIKLGKFLDAANAIHQLIAAAPDNPGLRLEAARLYLAGERPSKSLEMLNELAATESDSWQVFRLRADAHLNLAQHAEAIRDYDRVLELNPDDAETLNNLAWLLATSPQDDLRDANRSIEIAVKACELTDYSAPHILSTLAAGYAERGDFETAVRWSREAVALEIKEATEEDDIVEQLRAELQSYLDGKPWRELLEADEQDGDGTPVPPRVLGPNDA
ncbi:MAG: tetratricopeptide repeat protein, partial [Planctomycetales bacterium]|nr:tetratricopeptide repeat protein [Planctomycetales bacterium]